MKILLPLIILLELLKFSILIKNFGKWVIEMIDDDYKWDKIMTRDNSKE